MPMFQYQPFDSRPWAASIGDLLAHLHDPQAQAAQQIGAAQARAQEISGQAYGGAFRDAGGAVAGAIQTATDPRRQLEQQQVDANNRTQQFTGTVNSIVANLTKQNPDGSRTLDRDQLQQQFSAANVPLAMQEQTFKALDDVDSSISKFQTAKTDHLADLAHGVLQAGGTPDALAFGVALAKANGLVTDDQLGPLNQAVASGADLKPILEQIRGVSEKYKDVNKPIALGREGSLVTPSGQTLVAPTVPKPQPTTASLAADAATLGTPNETPTAAQSKAALDALKPPKDSASQQSEKYIKILTDQRLGKPVTPEDQAWAKSYVDNKTIGPEAAAAAASLRQANTIAQQNALQQHAQAFQEAQAGRSELTNKVEQPYLDAREKADTLRAVVAAAQHGNMEAAGVQKLMGTLGVVTMEGVKRINTAEMDQVGGAGSLFTEIKSKVGKIVAGQPLPADLQKDLTELSSLLEQGARHKYEQGFQQTTKRYGLKDETIIPPPASTVPPPVSLTPGLTSLAGRK